MITGNVDCRTALLTNVPARLEGVSLGPLIAPAVMVLTIHCFLLGEGCNSRLFSPVVGPGDGTTDYIQLDHFSGLFSLKTPYGS